ncbi:sporulation protein YpjB [Sporolactobacillus sp. THM19-2]|uniref:sporulation protein YpjB n=1 Tax=Sporolactobacillus sp. THM19-2 TaxID=2511171 RepID=UPI0010213FAC|nr:sporulation protein YpjB [Sporolactobacillus sp. THM19-2]RYL93236.1 hypothetical protein EWH91_05160 [Sporolactobacillus sp. THM19-2]
MKSEQTAFLFCLILFLIFISGFYIPDEKQKKTDNAELIGLSDRIYQYTAANQNGISKNLLDQYHVALADKRKQFAEDDRRVLETLSSRLKLLLRSDVNNKEAEEAALALRLGTDASISDSDPLWKNMYPRIAGLMNTIKEAVENDRDPAVIRKEFNQFLNVYASVYPSLYIDSTNDKLMTTDEHIAQLSQETSSNISKKEWLAKVSEVEKDLNQIFTREESLPENPGSDLLVFVSGGALIAVLTYVSWRKYHATVVRRQKR